MTQASGLPEAQPGCATQSCPVLCLIQTRQIFMAPQYTGQINFPAEKYHLQNVIKQFLRIYKMQYVTFHFGDNVLLHLL